MKLTKITHINSDGDKSVLYINASFIVDIEEPVSRSLGDTKLNVAYINMLNNSWYTISEEDYIKMIANYNHTTDDGSDMQDDY